MSSKDKLTETKTKRARRTIQLDDQTGACLDEWRAIQAGRIERSGYRWRGSSPLVISTRYGTPVNRNNLQRSMLRISERAGLDAVVPYELRHTAITLQLDADHDMWRVADWAGTSERMIEEVYRHRLTRVSELRSVALGQCQPD